MSNGPTRESEITSDSALQPSAQTEARDGAPPNTDVDAFEKILEAAEDNNDGKVRRIIEERGVTELRAAARSGRLSLIVGQQGLTKLLHHAAENDNEGLLNIVFHDPNIEVNAVLDDCRVAVHNPCKGCTALILACWKGNTKIVEELLRKGADVHIYTKDGFTCLHIAAFCGHSDVVNFLLHGRVERRTWEECDLQYMATFCRKGEVVDFERREILALPKLFSKRRWALIERKSKIEEFTALHMAAGSSNQRFVDNVCIVESILEALIASVLVFYEIAENPKHAYELEDELWVDFLFQIQEGLHLVDGEISVEDILQNLAHYGNSVSGFAKESGMQTGNEYEGLVRAFVELVSYSNAKEMIGRTALHHATLQNRYNLVKFLMWSSQFGCIANVNTVDVDGLTSLHLASWTGYGRVAKELMSCSDPNRTEARDGLDDLFYGKTYIQPNAGTTNPRYRCADIVTARTKEAKKLERTLGRDRSGRSLVFMMNMEKIRVENVEVDEVFYSYFRIVESLDAERDNAEHWLGSSVWFEQRAGATPLHYAVEYNHADVVTLLILHPSTDVFRRASDGKSPWTIAFPRQMKKTSPLQIPTQTQCVLRGEMTKLRELDTWGFYAISRKNYFHSRKVYQRQLFKQAVELVRRGENDSDLKGSLQMLEGQIIEAFASYLERESRYKSRFATLSDREVCLRSLSLLQAAAYYGLGPEIEVLLTLQTYREHVNDRENFTSVRQTALHFAVDGGVDAVAALLKEKTINLIQQNGTEREQTPLDFVQVRIDTLTLIMKFKYGGDATQDLLFLGFRTTRPEASLKIFKETQRTLMENPILVERLYRDRQVFADAASAILVGAALIASVTFGGFLQPPLGYVPFSQEQSSTPESFAAVEQHISVRVFWTFNSLSFFLAIATVVAGGGAVLPTSGKSIEEEVRMVRQWLRWTAGLLAMSILCVLGAFTASGFASLPNVFKYERNIIATSATGLAICVAVLCRFSHRLYLSFNPSSVARIVISETIESMQTVINSITGSVIQSSSTLQAKIVFFVLNRTVTTIYEGEDVRSMFKREARIVGAKLGILLRSLPRFLKKRIWDCFCR